MFRHSGHTRALFPSPLFCGVLVSGGTYPVAGTPASKRFNVSAGIEVSVQ
jgi:hypothetical protein